MINRVFSGIGLSLFIALALLGWKYREQVSQVALLTKDLTHYQRALEIQTQATELVQQERAHLEKVLAEREKNRQEEQAQTYALRSDIERLRRENDEIEKWATQRVPSAVIERLRQRSAGNH
jgi:septal ring factor EnvC (AmiA/AmiB activator)